MYPKLRNDIYLAPVNAQQMLVAVDGRGHHMEGQSIYALTERLLPFLNGKHHLQDLTRNLPEDKARAVTGLIEGLHRLGAVRDHTANREVHLDEASQVLYARPLAFLETLTEGAYQAFERFQNSRMVIVGAGSAVRTLAPALWESGLRHGTVVSSVQPLEALQHKWRAHAARDPQSRWTFTDQLPETPADLVVVIGTPEEIHARLQDPAILQSRVLPLALTRDFAVLGPVEVHWQQVLSQIEWEPALPDTSTAYSVMGARAALEAFRLLCGLPSVTETQLLRICTRTLTDSTHPLEIRELKDAVDPFSGLLSSVDEENLLQLPVKLLRVHSSKGDTLLSVERTVEKARTSGILAGLAHTLPERQGWQRAWGRTAEEMQGMGVLLWAEEQAGESTLWEDAAEHLSKNASLYWKTLKMRHHLQPVIFVQSVQDLRVVEVRHGNHLLGRAAGVTGENALEMALLRALGQVQSESSDPVAPPLPEGVNWQDVLKGIDVQVEHAPHLRGLQTDGGFVGWVKVQ
ncbi:hypothetical protein [Deinococcus cellulosilyticus]|uniref:Uncharacterized protein n=1 Tax=Deinococcus cellulosilyticus (strain DSM 18568 / NBRC 106333 / KACC 11606 / 5516J-15) TaxID=1223518 RepID=A0A511N318_DEIC1|nr:hypothetical protein [Deinococcus cellulosilyticus]GEM46897.1 hypothetical protein DC3_25320 [Deinococcus cellulosilyticus NBRC 106333 = KACC 11606]